MVEQTGTAAETKHQRNELRACEDESSAFGLAVPHIFLNHKPHEELCQVRRYSNCREWIRATANKEPQAPRRFPSTDNFSVISQDSFGTSKCI